MRAHSFVCLALVGLCAKNSAQVHVAKVTPPSEAFFLRYRDDDQNTARKFYTKCVDLDGLYIAASKQVSDAALLRTYEIVTHLLQGRPDVIEAMKTAGTHLIVIGKDQVYTDMPEYRNVANAAYMNERVRGTGGLGVTSFGEENLLNLPLDRYDDESIAVHEFCHTIDAALATIDTGWRARLRAAYQHALDAGLWTNAYAAGNAAEYWAEICQSYFDCNRINNWNHINVGTREQLAEYDPVGYELVKTTFNLSADDDWRYRPVRLQPSVITPPAKFGFDRHYTKFTFAREFPILGSKRTSDKAMLVANDVVRKVFAYRHDILKAMINDHLRLVVLGKGETAGDLPELKGVAPPLRVVDGKAGIKVLAVPEENVLQVPDDPLKGESGVVRAMATGMYATCAQRPVDPDFPNRRDKQQYELRVKRIDIEFDQRLAALYEKATAQGLWKGSPAARDRVEYWVAGMLAYFDAAGDGNAPIGAERPVGTREALKAYDPGLFGLVDETMAYYGHVDWRLPRNSTSRTRIDQSEKR